MTKQLKEIEIPFGAKDSELCGWEYTIPEGMEATIVDNKIIVRKKESEDEKIRKTISDILLIDNDEIREILDANNVLMQNIDTWLEKQGETFTKKDVDDAYLKGICDAKHELEKQGEQKPAWSEEDGAMLDKVIKRLHKYSAEDEEYLDKYYWLKELKHRVQPQSHWKPSDAQIASLTIACDRNDRIGFDLTQLLKDLKKLKKY